MSETNDEQQILALHEAGDKALMSADVAALAQSCTALNPTK